MEIILNEYEWAKKAVEEKTLHDMPRASLVLIAKYYFSDGYKTNEVRELLHQLLLDDGYDLPYMVANELVEDAIKVGKKYKPTIIESIVITKPELERISKLDKIQLKRLAFTLLCLAKFYRARSNADGWVATPIKAIMKMANINESVKRQDLLYYQLGQLGMIEFSKKIADMSVRVTYEEAGDPALYITDFRNLGYQYECLNSGKFIRCEKCGLVIREKNYGKAGRRQKYCQDCAAKTKSEQDAAAWQNRKLCTQK